MRTLEGFSSAPTFEDWYELVVNEPVYLMGYSYRYYARNSGKSAIGAVRYVKKHDTIYVQTVREDAHGKRILGKKLLTINPDYIEIITDNPWSARHVKLIEMILQPMGIHYGWAMSGKYRGKYTITQKSSAVLDVHEQSLHSVLVEPGLKFDYSGKCLNSEVLYTVAAARKAAYTFVQRSKNAIQLHNIAAALGFHNAFNLGGYPMPTDKSTDHLEELTQKAHQMGYESVAHAWGEGVPIIGKIDEQWDQHHEEGLTRLLGDAMKESKKK